MKTMQDNHGVTLVEIMVSMVISGLLMAGIYGVYTIQQRTYTVQEQVAELQQRLRSAMDNVKNNIMMAGYDPSGVCKAQGLILRADDKKIIFDLCDPKDTASPTRRITYQFKVGNNTFQDGDNTFQVVNDVGRNNPVPPDKALTETDVLVSDAQAIVEGVEAVEFRFFAQDVNGNDVELAKPVTTPGSIRSVQLSMLVRASAPDTKYADSVTYKPGSVLDGTSTSVWDINGSTSGTGNPPNGDSNQCRNTVVTDLCHYHRWLLIATIKLRNMGLQ